jgi:hypothetical protein
LWAVTGFAVGVLATSKNDNPGPLDFVATDAATAKSAMAELRLGCSSHIAGAISSHSHHPQSAGVLALDRGVDLHIGRIDGALRARGRVGSECQIRSARVGSCQKWTRGIL